MKHFFRVVPALVAILFGSVLLLPLLAWATIHDPALGWADYRHAVLRGLLKPRFALAVLIGLAAVVLGLAQLLRVGLLQDASGQERRQALAVFWLALGIVTAALLSLLVGVNYLALLAGKTPLLSWRVCL